MSRIGRSTPDTEAARAVTTARRCLTILERLVAEDRRTTCPNWQRLDTIDHHLDTAERIAARDPHVWPAVWRVAEPARLVAAIVECRRRYAALAEVV
ncbi:MAG: hypothetical protein OXH70_17405 [Acidobacteria bacterium]|nr:hypothetical protein [Acidobacteriota bacterium]